MVNLPSYTKQDHPIRDDRAHTPLALSYQLIMKMLQRYLQANLMGIFTTEVLSFQMTLVYVTKRNEEDQNKNSTRTE